MITGYSNIISVTTLGFDPDAAAFFARVTAAGGSLTLTEKTATNQLVLDLKANSLWTPMKAIYPMVGASAAACAQNLKSSSFTGTFTSGWTFASTGVTPNGTSAYMDTGLTPSGNLTNNNTHISYYSRTDNAIVTSCDIGVSGGSPLFLPINLMYIRTNLNFFRSANYNYGTPTVMDTSNTDAKGFYMGNRTSNVLTNCWKNGSKQNTNTSSEIQNISTVTNTYYLGACNLGGSPDQYSSRQCAFSSIGNGLLDAQASAFYSVVQSFQVALNRAV